MNKPISAKAKRVLGKVLFLREYYRRGYKKNPLYHCPLCSLGCDSCPWYFLEDIWCLDNDEDICEKREKPSPQWRAASIKRLTRWVRLIKDGTYDKRLREAKP